MLVYVFILNFRLHFSTYAFFFSKEMSAKIKIGVRKREKDQILQKVVGVRAGISLRYYLGVLQKLINFHCILCEMRG